MKSGKRLVCLALLAMLLSEAQADSYRCGRKLVRDGDSVSELLRICGEPHFKGKGNETVEINGVPRNVSVKQWHYRKNRRSLEHVVLIYQGKIVAIEAGGR